MLRYCPPFKRVAYQAAEAVQQQYARQLLDAKAAGEPGPPAALFAFEMDPVYTAGRQQRSQYSAEQIEEMKRGGPGGATAEFFETLRGGHLTFHGPGQVVMYPVVDLARLGAKRLTVRDFVCNLEGGLIDVLKRYGIQGKRTKDNGVWVSDREKIASVGIHVRRGVTSHGIALNVTTDPAWFARVVACNLPNASVVSMAQYATAHLRDVADQLAAILAERLHLDLAAAAVPADIPHVFEDSPAAAELTKLYGKSSRARKTATASAKPAPTSKARKAAAATADPASPSAKPAPASPTAPSAATAATPDAPAPAPDAKRFVFPYTFYDLAAEQPTHNYEPPQLSQMVAKLGISSPEKAKA